MPAISTEVLLTVRHLLKTQRIYKKADKEHVTGANRVKKATKSAGKCSVTAKTVKTPFFTRPRFLLINMLPQGKRETQSAAKCCTLSANYAGRFFNNPVARSLAILLFDLITCLLNLSFVVIVVGQSTRNGSRGFCRLLERASGKVVLTLFFKFPFLVNQSKINIQY